MEQCAGRLRGSQGLQATWAVQRDLPACRQDAVGRATLTGLTWTCSSVKMGCSSIGGIGVLVVTDASRICLKTCRRDGQKAAGEVTAPLWFLATQQAIL